MNATMSVAVPLDDDDIPTQPQGGLTNCPWCRGPDGVATGDVVREEWREGHLHRMVRRPCDYCGGRKFVTRNVAAVFKPPKT